MKTTFQVTGSKLIVTDPCYSRGTWCQGILENVKPGTWMGSYELSDEGPWGERVKKLLVMHVKCNFVRREGAWHTADFDVGVDSGQAGVFDEARYPGKDNPEGDDEEFEYEKEGGFYNRACAATHHEKDRSIKGGAIEEGYVSSSGFGDGGYTCEFYRDKEGLVTAVQIVFITEGDEEEDEELI